MRPPLSPVPAGRRPPDRSTAPARVVAGPGQALHPAVSGEMSHRFGVDFSAVRVHADDAAAQSARSVGAAAYALGSHLVFGAGNYAPQSASGRQLLAHELAHVVQQSRGGSALDAELRADAAAAQALGGTNGVSLDALGGAPVSLQAQPDPSLAAGPEALAEISQTTTTLSDFALNSATLTAAHQEKIKTLAWSIKMHLGIRVNANATLHVTGHTDTSGGESLNQALGQKRAEAVQAALREALTAEGVTDAQIVALDAASAGESRPLVPTGDGVKNATNRRVEVQLGIGQAPPPQVPATQPKINLNVVPGIDGGPPPRPGPIRDPKESKLWEDMEANQRKIDETAHLVPKPKSVTDVLKGKALDIVEPLIKRMPKFTQGPLRSAIEAAIDKGSEAACESAIDASGATGETAEGLKTACKAALKLKSGGGGKTP